MARITIEKLLTHPNAFGLTTATPVQRAICRVADGLPLDDLASDRDVVEAFGGPDAIEALPVGVLPAEIYLLAAIRCGKSLLTAAAVLRSALECDVSNLRPGEVPRVSILALDKDKADVILNDHIIGTFQSKPFLKRLMVGNPTAEAMCIKRESDGRIVEIRVVAGKRAGGSLVSRWSAGVVFDEAPRMQGQEEGVVNFEHGRSAVLGRLLPGAQLWAVGSPWAPRGPIFDAVQESFGKPSANRVVIRGRGPTMNPILWTPAACEALRLKDETAHRTDVLGEFADPQSAFFASDDLLRIMKRTEPTLPREPGVSYIATMDPATRGNGWTLVVAGLRMVEGKPILVIANARQWVGSKSNPLNPRVVLGEIAAICKPYGVNEVHTDQWSSDALASIAVDNFGLFLSEKRLTMVEKVKAWESFRTAVVQELVDLPPDPVVRSDLLAVRKRITTASIAIDIPPTATADGRHYDFAPTIMLASAVLGSSTGWDAAVAAFIERGGKLFADPKPQLSEEKKLTLCQWCNQFYYGPCPTHGRVAA
jgi:hypothetical protein